MNFRFSYPLILMAGGFVILLALWWRARVSTGLRYRYSFAALWKEARNHNYRATSIEWIQPLIRLSILVLLVCAAARPRSPDEKTQVAVEGISIMLLLDVSRSMDCFDDIKDQRSRFVIAQEEAIRFVERRPYDQFGLVLFGSVAATRCPLTSDRFMLREIIRTTNIGVISDEGTVLAQAIAMGVRRLAASQATSKIIVLLTDGEPSPEDMPHVPDAVSLAQKANVKIYTIGIGSEQRAFIHHPLGGIVQVESRLQTDLLRAIAARTGGACFEARNQRDLATIYQTIDSLEKSTQSEPLYAHWYEWYMPLLVVAFCLFIIDLGSMAWQVLL